jgi:hypothetical protein
MIMLTRPFDPQPLSVSLARRGWIVGRGIAMNKLLSGCREAATGEQLGTVAAQRKEAGSPAEVEQAAAD